MIMTSDFIYCDEQDLRVFEEDALKNGYNQCVYVDKLIEKYPGPYKIEQVFIHQHKRGKPCKPHFRLHFRWEDGYGLQDVSKTTFSNRLKLHGYRLEDERSLHVL